MSIKSIKKGIFLCLSLFFAQSLNCLYLSEQDCQCLSKLLNMPENTKWSFYNTLIEEEVLPLLKEQITKYHPSQAEPHYYSDRDNEWRAYETGGIDIPIRFIASIIQHRIHNTPIKRDITFWDDIASLHHEMTHIKNQHFAQKRALYGRMQIDDFVELLNEYKDDQKKIRAILAVIDDFLSMRRKHEREADEGIPNHRLMLLAEKSFYEQRAIRENPCLGNFTHPSDKDRAARFAQRLETLLKERAQAVSNAFKFNLVPKVIMPQAMPTAPDLLRIKPETYESILDVIGEYKPVFDINLQKISPKKPFSRRLFMPFVPFK